MELGNAAAQENRARQDAVDAVAWKVLEAKLHKVRGDKGQLEAGKNFQAHLAELFGESEC